MHGRLIVAAIVAGLLASLPFGLLQQWLLMPIIAAAEAFEAAGPYTAVWHPAPGVERLFYSLLANALTAIAMAAILMAVMARHYLARGGAPSSLAGLLWGLAGFAVMFAVPALGLPPEIPGMDAARLGNRQLWWLLAAGATAGGLALAFYGWPRFAAPALAVMVLPWLVGVPAIVGDVPEGALRGLHLRFVWASAAINLGFWLALGLLCRWLLCRLLRPHT